MTAQARTVINTDAAAAPVGPYSQAIASGDFVFLAGQVPVTRDGSQVTGDIRAQTEQVLNNVRAVLAGAGLDLIDVIQVRAFLSDLADFPVFNEVYGEFFVAPFPARTTIGCQLNGFLVEVDVVARATSAPRDGGAGA